MDKRVIKEFGKSKSTLNIENKKKELPIIESKRRDEEYLYVFQSELLRKYFYSWLKLIKDTQYVNEKQSKNEKIDAFLKSIIIKKNELNSTKKSKQKINPFDNLLNLPSSTQMSQKAKTDMSSFRNSKIIHQRFQMQKNIIALQKTKLEQQERIIEELKFKKIVEDASLSSEVITDVCKALQKCDRSIKPKLKCFIGDNDNDDETAGKSFELQCTRVPKILQKMELRAREREEKRAVVRERRRQIELEREKIKEQMELARQLMDQEDKNKRMNEFKEKRRQEQLIAIRNKEIRERMRALTVMADLHYEKKIMNKYGPDTWRLFIHKVKNDLIEASFHYQHSVMKNNFNMWKNVTNAIVNQRIELADTMHYVKTVRRVFHQWKLDYKEMINKRQVAEDWYELHVTERLFIQWKANIVKLKILRKYQWDLAVQHFDNRLKWRAIDCWEMLPKINAIEREHEARKQRWRLKVQQVIPDFIPRHLDI